MNLKILSWCGPSAAFIVLSINVFERTDWQLSCVRIYAILAELHLTDTQIGLMAGMASAVACAIGPQALVATFKQLRTSRAGVATDKADAFALAHVYIAQDFAARK